LLKRVTAIYDINVIRLHRCCGALLNSKMIRQNLIQLILLSVLTPAISQQRELVPENEVFEILELAINLPELQEYYHVDVDSSRIPLIIKEFGSVNSNNLKGLTKFDKPVLVLNQQAIKESENKAYLNIGDWTYGGDNLRLQLNYLIEGITINYRFSRINSKWEIVNSLIWEE
jgi:hypothetical protein